VDASTVCRASKTCFEPALAGERFWLISHFPCYRVTQAGAADHGGVEARTLRFDDGVDAVLLQQLIQPAIEIRCRSRVRLPIDMGGA
jgi:hypothetical protein